MKKYELLKREYNKLNIKTDITGKLIHVFILLNIFVDLRLHEFVIYVIKFFFKINNLINDFMIYFFIYEL